MKKLVIILTTALMLLSGFAFAADSDKVNARIKAAFLSDFTTASGVTWEKISDFYFARFTLNNIELNAAYNEDGELIGTSRQIELSQLPLNVSMAVGKKYQGYTVSPRALELTYEEETSYYLTVFNDRQALKIKCYISGNIEVERRMKKK